jgi:glycosyltransferase involved in cell wall biosynthesis
VDPEQVALSLFLLVRDEPNELLPGVPAHIPIHISPFSRRDPRGLKWLADGFRRERIELAHSFLWSADMFAAMSKRLFGWGSLIISERGDRGFSGYSARRQRFDRWLTFPSSQWACANSAFGQRLLISLGYPAAKSSFIHNGISLSQIDRIPPASLRQAYGWPEGCALVGNVSRLMDYKGVDTFVRALACLNQQQPAVYGVIVGYGQQEAELKALAEQLGLSQRLAFAGRIGAAAAIKEWDVAVLSSRTEHCSNSLLEYMACGKPVVATNVGGNPELVVAGETGLLVPPDNPAGLAHALGTLLNAPEQRASMGRRGRERVERDFALSVTASRFVRLWQSVAAGR